MREIDPQQVADKYNKQDQIWNENDKWHIYTKSQIDKFVDVFLASIKQPSTLLNAGSGGTIYKGWESQTTHLDIAADRLKHLKKAIVCDLHLIPLPSSSFDVVMCIGSVINYCDALVVFGELCRIVRPGGHLILEFENSFTWELIGKRSFNKKAVLIDTFYANQAEKIWYYSESYIRELAYQNGMQIKRYQRFHIITPLIYRITKSVDFASKFKILDSFFLKIPFFNRFASNVIFHLSKRNADH